VLHIMHNRVIGYCVFSATDLHRWWWWWWW